MVKGKLLKVSSNKNFNKLYVARTLVVYYDRDFYNKVRCPFINIL